ncbi:MAG: type II toxin-antitoxin system VapC family toxin [Blastocatellia bacterium]
MTPVLFDTSVYISSLRQGDDEVMQARNPEHGSPLWLSAVVLEELYAGADAAGRKKLAKFERDFEKIGRLLVPILTDWSRTGEVLAQIGEKYGYEQIGRSRLTNDTLIGTSAARQGVTLLTVNGRDFARVAEFCHLKWSLWQGGVE